MSNYPPGMTDSDWDHINGALDEYDEIVYRIHECEEPHEKDWSGAVDAYTWEWRTGTTTEWTCPQCGVKVEEETP